MKVLEKGDVVFCDDVGKSYIYLGNANLKKAKTVGEKRRLNRG